MNRPLAAGARLALALLWLALLGIGGWWLGQHLQLSGDLRKFMPRRRATARPGAIGAAAAADAIRTPMYSYMVRLR